MVRNDAVGRWDFLGLETGNKAFISVIGKSYIDGFPRLQRPGETSGPTHYGLLQLEGLLGGLDAFNEKPPNDRKDGEYRLSSEVWVEYCCKDNDDLPARSIVFRSEGGVEALGIRGTINLHHRVVNETKSSFVLKMTAWGRPNKIVEPGMQSVGRRTSKNIWHTTAVKFECKNGRPQRKLLGFAGSRFPSHKLWIDTVEVAYLEQGYLSDLWQAWDGNETFVR